MNNLPKNQDRHKIIVGIVDDERCEYHNQGEEHQESPDRVRAIRRKLKDTGIYDHLVKIEAVEPTKDDLLLVHTNTYINKVIRTCTNYKSSIICNEDVRVNGKDSLISAGIAVGSVLAAVDAVLTTPISRVFCNVRPPGHHATSHEASGFCIFNNVAIGVKKALTYEGINKVLIFDWDLHHGNGTQSIFRCNKRVMFSSFHRAAPFYPATGKSTERGKYGTTYNYPQHNDTEMESYMKDFYTEFLPNALEFNPDLIFISCGFDSHKDDMYHALPLNYKDFKLMTKELCLLANQCCNGRLISVLEGGYTLDVLENCTAVHINEMLSN